MKVVNENVCIPSIKYLEKKVIYYVSVHSYFDAIWFTKTLKICEVNISFFSCSVQLMYSIDT